MGYEMNPEFDAGMAGDGPNDVIQATAYFDPDRAGWWRRVMRRLFPSKRVTFPEPKWPAKDCLVVHAVTRFSWSDRLRILVTGTVESMVKGVTEHDMGRVECEAVVYPVWGSDVGK